MTKKILDVRSRLTGGGKASQQRGVARWPYRTVIEASPFTKTGADEQVADIEHGRGLIPR